MITLTPVTRESAALRAQVAADWTADLAELLDRMPALIGFWERHSLRAALCVIRLDVERARDDASRDGV